jgi:hypothetical protein
VYYKPVEPWETGYAVRREWPDGTHQLVGFSARPAAMVRFIRRDRSYWRGGPGRPRLWGGGRGSPRDFDLHAKRRDCRSPDCPRAGIDEFYALSP